MSSQVCKGVTPIYAQNVRKSFTPRMNLFDQGPFGHAQQPQKPAINENNEFHINDGHFATISQSMNTKNELKWFFRTSHKTSTNCDEGRKSSPTKFTGFFFRVYEKSEGNFEKVRAAGNPKSSYSESKM